MKRLFFLIAAIIFTTVINAQDKSINTYSNELKFGKDAPKTSFVAWYYLYSQPPHYNDEQSAITGCNQHARALERMGWLVDEAYAYFVWIPQETMHWEWQIKYCCKIAVLKEEEPTLIEIKNNIKQQ